MSRGAALVAVALTVLATVGERLTVATTASWREVRAPGPARLEDAIGALAGAAAVAVVAWLALAVLVSALAALAPPSLTVVRALAAAVAPRLVRHGVATLMGAVVVGGTATSAHAAGDPGLTNRAAASALVASARHDTGAVLPASVDAGWRPTGGGVSPGWLPTPPAASRPMAAGPHEGVQIRPRPGSTVDDEVVVRRGDTLWTIAARHLGPGATAAEIAHEWPRWYVTNRGLIGRDPDHLSPGLRLRQPELITTTTAAAGAGGVR